MIISSRASRSATCAIRSKPFWAAKRDDDSDDRQFRVGILNPKRRQQILLAFRFAGEILRRELGGRELVRLRTPFLVVDAVENSCHG